MLITIYVLRKNRKKHKLIINFTGIISEYEMPLCNASIPDDIFADDWYSYTQLRYILYKKFRIRLPRYRSLKWIIDISDHELKQFAVIHYAGDMNDEEIHNSEE